MTEERLEKALSLLTGVLNYDSFKDVDLVIEVGFFFQSSYQPLISYELFFRFFGLDM